MRYLATALLLGMTAACSATSSPSASSPNDPTSPPPQSPAASSTAPHLTPCQAFARFMTDLTTYTPRDPRILPDAERVQEAALATNVSRRVANDASELVAFVGSPTWQHNGNYLSAPVQRMMEDCP